MPGHRNAWRWTRRLLLGVAAIVVIAIAAVLIAIHTAYGRELIRKQVEARLAETFTGGATLGKVEGSLFSELRLRDLVINGPDGKPAIRIGTATLELDLLPLLSRQARLAGLVADDVDVILERDPHGAYEIQRLVKPGPTSTWSVFIAKLAVHRGHVQIDTGHEVMNLDGIEIFGAAQLPQGKPLKANLAISALWRERAAAIALQTVVESFDGTTQVPSLIATVGSVTVAAAGVRIVASRPGAPPVIDGSVFVHAPRAGVRQLVPSVDLPADVSVAVQAWSAMPWTQLSLVGMVGETPVRAMVSADVAHLRVLGVVASGALDVGALTRGKIVGTGGGIAIFDAMPGQPGELPHASGVLTAWSQLAEAPNANVAIAFTTSGDRASTVIGLAGPGVSASVSAEVTKVGDVITLDRSTVLASTRDLATASGGRAPVLGRLRVELAASGALLPTPNLAVTGKINGANLRMKDVSVATLDLAVEATQLPRQPRGHAMLHLTGIVRQEMQLGALDVDARNHDTGQIHVVVRSRPKQGPWLIDLDALITPPGKEEVTLVDIQRHHLRAGAGQDWYGNSGHIAIGPNRIEVRDLRSHSAGGKLAVAARLARASGDLTAKVDATGIDLANLGTTYRGNIDAHVAVARRHGRWAGDVDVTAKGIAAEPSPFVFDTAAKIHASAGKLVVDASASAVGVGAATLALDVDAPKNIADVAAWRGLGRGAFRRGQLALQNIDLAKAAQLAGHPDQLTGRLDGDLEISSTTTRGLIQIHELMAPALRGTSGINADLALSQSPNDVDEIDAKLRAKVEGIGGILADARVAMPDRWFDPAAWKAKGRGVLRGASMRIENVNLDPGLFDRFDIVTQLRGRASLAAEIADAARSARIAVDVIELRGSPIAQPIELHLTAAIDEHDARATLAVRAKSTPLLEVRGTVPVSIDQLLEHPSSVRAAPLSVTAEVPRVPAAAFLGVFGRNEITGGTLEGTVKIAGTIGAPTLTASFEALRLQVPPGRANKPVRTIEQLELEARWDGTLGRVAIDGKQQAGRLRVRAQGSPMALAEATLSLQATQFDLGPMLAFAPGPAGGAAGRLDASLTMEGLDLRTSKLAGELHLSGARVPIAPNVGTLRRAKIDVVIKDHMLDLDVDGRLGAGTVKVAGKVALDGSAPQEGNAKITLRKVSPIGTVEPVIDADVTAKLGRRDAKWVAEVSIQQASVDVPSDRGEELKPVGAPTDMVFASGERVTSRPLKKEAPRNAAIEIHINLASTHVKSKEFNGSIRGKLVVTADTQSVGLVGDVEAERGDLDLFDRRYLVERAAVHFDGSPDPLLDIRITHDFSDVTTITEVHGRASKPQLTMSSSTGVYSQGQLLGFLLGGEPNGDPQGASTRDVAASVGTSVVVNWLSGYVKRALPVDIDVLRYEASSAASSAAITVGTWLTRSLFLAYRVHLESRPDENTGEGQLEYWLTKRFMVEAIAGDRNIDGVDLLWRKRY